MRQEPNLQIEQYRRVHPALGASPSGSNYGFFVVRKYRATYASLPCDGEGWDHVSVSLEDRCPTWGEIQFVKELFFDDSETVVQFHPRKSHYVNKMPHCLHLWKRHGSDYDLPPEILI